MDENHARALIALQAFETAHPASPSWSDDDSAWATRLAQQDAAAATFAPEAYLVRRAEHGLQRLAPREPALARWLTRRLWRPAWLGMTALLAFALGIAADAIGSGQRINLLSPPLWGVMAWNACVYLAGIGVVFAHLLRRQPAAPGPLRLAVQRLLRRGLPGAHRGGAWQVLAALWLRACAPLSMQRAAALMHAGAAALALGLIAGLYARGLVLDYRAEWESTFLTPASVHAWLTTLLGPASSVAGIPLPDVAGIAALQTAHGAATAGASAAPWIHLLALTLAGFVVLPRALLGLVAAWRAHRLARRFPLPLTDPYFQRLLRTQRGEAAHVVALPYAKEPGAQAALGLRTLLAAALGETMSLRIAALVAFGAEDEAAYDMPADTTLAIALFDLAATPEPENQGRYLERVAAAAPAGATVIVVIDEASFARRFGAAGERIAQRRAAWRGLVERHGSEPVFVDLEGAEPALAAHALQSVLAMPVRVTAIVAT